jgi:hypothetical protein
MSIVWFPGHMAAARKEAAKTMGKVDVVVELLDARLPGASANPLIERLRSERQRPCLKVLNKADLADPDATAASSPRRPGETASPTSSCGSEPCSPAIGRAGSRSLSRSMRGTPRATPSP